MTTTNHEPPMSKPTMDKMLIQLMIADAVKVEREACASAAEDLLEFNEEVAIQVIKRRIAATIRNRPNE